MDVELCHTPGNVLNKVLMQQECKNKNVCSGMKDAE